MKNIFKNYLFMLLILLLCSVAYGRNISVIKVSDPLGKYETFTAFLQLEGIDYQNPYDPQQVDVQGLFKSPSGKMWKMFGYYDDYREAANWLLKFCPNEAGDWVYSLSVKDINGTVRSSSYSFKVIDSGLHGWLKVSPANPYYFEYDDGTTFYGVGMYYPWNINRQGLDILEANGANFFGYWNITWDSDILESMKSGLGRYDQSSSARIDEILEWSEERNMKMMFALWPHDLLAGPVLQNTGWNKEWENNPYNSITSAKDFYASEEAWQYQLKLYRYIIARFGNSRSMGIWEIVNEINGTDGGDNTPEALAWVERVHTYFKEHDPYDRPTTANQSGGRFWTDGYRKVDVATLHVYENQFESNPFPDQPLRSSYTLYHDISEYFRKNFEKPAFMGEAGFTAPDNVFGDFKTESAEYDTLYHNALWACWAGGNAATPLWWDFGSRRVVTPERLRQMKIFSDLVGKIDYAHIPFSLARLSAATSDTHGLSAGNQAMGWIIDSKGGFFKEDTLHIYDLEDNEYETDLYNPWSGQKITRVIAPSQEGVLKIHIPAGAGAADLLFFTKQLRK